jgi:4-amino-4-deoxy-L-arabinose transferase-like glycosyltransferase
MTDVTLGRQSLARWVPFGIFLAAFLTVAFTTGDYGVTWDEPPYFHAADLHFQWMAEFTQNLLHGEVSKSLDDKRIQAAWHWDPYHVPHPPFSRIVSGITHAIFSPWLDEFVSYRLGPAVFFALLITVMYLWMTEVFGRPIGLFAALSVALIPNMFGFAHIAVTDMPLAAMWFFTAYSFWKGLENWKWSLALGIIWGLALATKFPALLIPIPLVLWAHLFRRNSYSNNIIAMIFISPLIMIASQPYLWHQPFMRILEFLYEGVSRGYRADTNYPVFFLGRPYYSDQLPRYYPFFLTVVTTPETILALSLIGIIALVQNRPERKVMMLFLFNALFILTMGALPGAVLHDGMRQMLSVYPFLAGLSAAGFFFLVRLSSQWAQRIKPLQSIKNLQTKLIAALAVLLIFPPLLDVSFYHPFQLSYYNVFVGGLRGAYDRGLEATYFMEAITPRFLDHLNQKLPPGAVVNGLFANSMLEYYQKEGRLRADLKITDGERFDYALVLNRRSILGSVSRGIWASIDYNDQPYAAVSLAGVPLVSVYRTKPAK